MKRKTLPLLALVATTLFLSACDDRSDDLKAISKFKDLTPPRFSGVVSRQDDVREEWSQVADCSFWPHSAGLTHPPVARWLRGWQLLLSGGYGGENRPAADECALYCRQYQTGIPRGYGPVYEGKIL